MPSLSEYVLERIDEHRLAKIGVSVDIVLTFRRRGEPQLDRRGEVVQDAAPVPFVVSAAAMAFVDDDKVKEVGRIGAEMGRRMAVDLRPAHEGLEDRQEDAAVLRRSPLLADLARFDAYQRVVGERREGVVGLVGEDVAIGEEQNPRPPFGPSAQVPARLKQLPRELKRDEGLAGAGGEREQDPLAAVGDRLQHPLDGEVLVVAPLEVAAPIFERHGGEAVAPLVLLGERLFPELVRRGKAKQLALAPFVHVD